MNPFSQKNSLDHPEYSVSELSYHLKHIVESNLSHVCVRGEISGYRGIHSSGHAY
ncbi:exodeoxyribonuclease VII large subunit, partial [Candidatus Liberibacter asiaticus]